MPVANTKPLRSPDETRLYRHRCRTLCRFLLPESPARSEQTGLCRTFEIRPPARVSTRAGLCFITENSPNIPAISLNPTASDPMIRILSAFVASVFALLAASCCCTGETKPPRLQPLPKFQEIQAAPEVHYSK